jgi:hypothetical protein
MDELNNEFKKTAEDFSLTPASETWMHVEADIRRRKRKRRLIIFFFLLAGLLAGGMFLLNNDSHKDLTAAKTNSGSQKNAVAINHSMTTPVTQQNISMEKVNPSNERNKSSEIVAQKRNQDRKSKNAVVENHAAKDDSVPLIENEVINIPPMLSEEDNQGPGTIEGSENCETVTFPTPLTESNNQVDSLSTFVAKDSIAVTAKTDSLSAKEDSLKGLPHFVKWSISLGFAPAITHTKLEEEGAYPFIANYRNSSDKNPVTLNYHIAINYDFLPGLGMYTGLGIIHFNQEILSKQVVHHDDTVYGVVTNPFTVAPYTLVHGMSHFNINDDSTGTVKNKFTFLSIPIGLCYNFIPGKRFNVSLLPEISFNKLINSEGYIYNDKDFVYQKISDSNLKAWLISYGVGLSFEYEILENICVNISPYYRSYQGSIYKESSPVSQRFRQTEFLFSLRYLIK